MTTRDIANRLVSLCRQGNNQIAVDELYANDIVSMEVDEPMKAVSHRGRQNRAREIPLLTETIRHGVSRMSVNGFRRSTS